MHGNFAKILCNLLALTVQALSLNWTSSLLDRTVVFMHTFSILASLVYCLQPSKLEWAFTEIVAQSYNYKTNHGGQSRSKITVSRRRAFTWNQKGKAFLRKKPSLKWNSYKIWWYLEDISE